MIPHILPVIFLLTNTHTTIAHDYDASAIEFRLEALQRQLDLNTKELSATKSELSATKYDLDATKEELLHMKKKDERRRLLLQEPDHQVMFTAQLSPHAEHLGENQVIKFNTIVTNVNSGYDPVTGIFTSPAAGKYFFIVTIMSHAGQWIETQMVVNGVRKMLIYSGACSDRYNQGTSSVIVALNAGDRVWLQTINTQSLQATNAHVYGLLWSSFSGFRISA